MPKKSAAATKSTPNKKTAKSAVKKTNAPNPKMPKQQKIKKPKAAKGKQQKLPKGKDLKLAGTTAEGTAEILSSEVVYQGPLFRVTKDRIVEPGGKENTRDVVRHNGSAVILAIDSTKSKKDPWIVMERQYRHAAKQFLWELPAGKMEAGEDPLTGAQRELEEETGYRAKKWKLLLEYWASPGFLGESMQLFLAEGLIPGHARPEDDEDIELRLVKLSEVLKAIEKGQIQDGKTLTGILSYVRMHSRKGK